MMGVRVTLEIVCPVCGSDDVEVNEASAPYWDCNTCGKEFRP